MIGEVVLDGVGVRHGRVVALDDVSLRVAPGEAVALLGPSGAGKTTLLRLVNGLQEPDTGRVLLDGEQLRDLPSSRRRALRSRIGFVPQDLALVPNLRVLTNVLSGRQGRQGLAGTVRDLTFPRRSDVERVLALLDRVGIGDLIYRRTDRLSGGQRQRVAVARALFQEPRVLLADEPVSSVDPARSRQLLELLMELGKSEGFALLVSLHDFGLARRLFPRLVGLKAGRVVFDDDASRIDESLVAQLEDVGEALA